MLVAVLSVAGAAHAYNESPARDRQEIQYDDIFETSQNAQLKVDQQYAAGDVSQSEIELNAERSRIQSLKTQNEQINDEVKKNTALAKQNRKMARIENAKAARLERLVNTRAKQLEKIKIANINLKKSIELAQNRQTMANAKLARIDAHRKAQGELRSGLQLKKKNLVKGKKIRTRMASR